MKLVLWGLGKLAGLRSGGILPRVHMESGTTVRKVGFAMFPLAYFW